MSGTTTKKLCCLTIGLETFVMPAADGMKVAALLQGAKPAVRTYDGGGEFSYTTDGLDADVTWTAVRAEQVKASDAGTPARRRRRSQPAAEAT